MSLLIDGKLVLTGFVGDDYWDDGFTSRQVHMALAELGRDADIPVLINSGGGYVHEGVAIYNAFIAHKGKVTVEVEGIAASAASVIAMAGDEIIMKPGATMMIHDPSTMTWGDAEDHSKSVEILDKQGDQIASIYVDRAGGDVASMRAEMKAELWLTGEEAVERGFATSVVSTTGSGTAPTAFDYNIYACAPSEMKKMAANKNWVLAPKQQAVASANAKGKHQKETSVPPKEKADDETANQNVSTPSDEEQDQTDLVAAATKRIQSILNCEEAKGREALANNLAFETELSVEQALASLKAAPAASEEASKNYDQSRVAAQALINKPGGVARATKNSLKPSDVYAQRRQQIGGA